MKLINEAFCSYCGIPINENKEYCSIECIQNDFREELAEKTYDLINEKMLEMAEYILKFQGGKND